MLALIIMAFALFLVFTYDRGVTEKSEQRRRRENRRRAQELKDSLNKH